MTTSFPGAKDNFTRPTGGDPLSNSHGITSTQYIDNLMDAVEAVESVLFQTVYNVKAAPYNAVGDGVTDDTTAIQAALDAAGAAGGGVVFMPAGTYIVHLVAHPLNGTYWSGLVVHSNTTLRGAGRNATTVKLAANQTRGVDLGDGATILYNYGLSGGDIDITIRDMTFDGNGSNQTHTCGGIQGIRTVGWSCYRVRVRNCRGTNFFGPNETFHFDSVIALNSTFVECEAEGTLGSTASGFSANASSNIRYVACIAHGMTVANGFTHWTCANVQHTACHSYGNVGSGFNSEVSESVQYTACIAGSRSTDAAGYTYSALTLLRNDIGFVGNGTKDMMYDGCIAAYNVSDGINMLNSSSGCIIGGSFHNNGVIGVTWQDATTALLWEWIGTPNLSANGSAPATINGGVGWFNPTALLVNPPVPATGVSVNNPYPFSVFINIDSAATNLFFTQINGNNHSKQYAVLVPRGGSIILNYGAPAPTQWTWQKVG